jgi:hypothetical protein
MQEHINEKERVNNVNKRLALNTCIVEWIEALHAWSLA